MKILMVWSRGFGADRILPLPYGYLINRIDRTKHQVKLLNCALDDISYEDPEFEKSLLDFNPDVLAFSSWSLFYHEVRRGIKIARKILPHAKIIIGGNHPSMHPQVLREDPEIDFAFKGESDLAIAPFLEELESTSPDFSRVPGLCYLKNDVVIENPVYFTPNLDVIAPPDYQFMEFDRYLKAGYRLETKSKSSVVLLGTRGCPYTCSFCCVPIHSGQKHRTHSVDYLLDHLDMLNKTYGTNYFNFGDDNFTNDMNFAKSFCRKLIERKRNYTLATPRGIRMQRTDQELFHLMKEAGWEEVVLAPESGSDRVLAIMHKSQSADTIYTKVKEAKNAGLYVVLNVIIGYPGETLEDIQKTREMLRKCRPHFFYIFNFNPLPGTPVYKELVEKEEITDRMLPKNFGEVDRVYTPASLKGVNFSRIVLAEYLNLFLHRPHYPIVFAFRKLKFRWSLYYLYINFLYIFTNRSDAAKIRKYT